MRPQILLLFTVILLASGCMSEDPRYEQSFQSLVNTSDNSSFHVTYAVSGPEIEDKIEINVHRKNGREKFRAVRETSGGTVIEESYSLENRTVSCYTSPSPRGGSTRCTVGESDGIYTFLNPDRWTVNKINRSTTENISSRECRKFSTLLEVEGQILDPGTELKADICLDTEKGFISKMNVSSDRSPVDFEVENFSSEVSEKDLGLPRAVGIDGHCTDSYDVELTPLKDVNEAVLSVNGENKTVTLPERFETQFYSIPQDHLDVGENTITVYTDEGNQDRYCYRRPE